MSTTGQDFATKEQNMVNSLICNLIGKFKTEENIKLLGQLVTNKVDPVALSAIKALGKFNSLEAVNYLEKVLKNKFAHKFLIKNAVIALGNAGQKEAIDILLPYLVVERQGVSFYAETSLALYKLGGPAIAAMEEILQNKNKTVNEHLKNEGGHPEAFIAKTLEIISDFPKVNNPKLILSYIKYKNEDAVKMLMVRMQAIRASGKLGLKKAEKPLLKMLKKQFDSGLLSVVKDALVKINSQKIGSILGRVNKRTPAPIVKEIIDVATLNGDPKVQKQLETRLKRLPAEYLDFYKHSKYRFDLFKSCPKKETGCLLELFKEGSKA